MPSATRSWLSTLIAACAVGGPAIACDVNSATDLSCGSASVNPMNPNSLNNPANPNNPDNPNSLVNMTNPNSPYNLAHPESPYSARNPNNPNSAEYRYRYKVLGEPYLKYGTLSLAEGGHPTVAYGGLGHERECHLGVDCPRSVYTPDIVLATGLRPEDEPGPPPRRTHRRSGR